MVLSGLEGPGSSSSRVDDERVACLDVNKAKRILNRAVRLVHGASCMVYGVCYMVLDGWCMMDGAW